MTQNQGLGESGVQRLQKLAHDPLLQDGAGVRRTALGIEPALIADPDTVGVVVLAMSPDHFDRAPGFDGAVAADDEMVAAAVLPAPGTMPAVDLFEAALLIRTNGGAMDDDKGDGTHCFKV